MTQNDCMDSKSEDVKLKEMRMAPDKVCPGPCPAGGPASSDGGGDGGECRPSSPLGPPTLPVPVALVTSMVHPSVALQLQQMKEGDGATAEGGEKGEGGGEDDDLTSLNWLLQDKNILKGINLRTAASGAQESPTSDYVDDSASEQGDSTCSSVNSSSPVPPNGASGSGRNKHPHHIPYDPKVHVTSKPPYSFSCLIFMAIEDCAEKALPVKEIYAWILDHFPYYKNAPTGWKNSVRHNLSLNKCFCKVEKAPNLGKGSLWMVDPVYRPNLVQALKKAPYHPYAVTGASSDRPVSSRTSQQPDSLSAAEQSDDVISTPTKSCAAAEPQPGRLLPDPDLFPYLSRRLLAAAAAAAAAAGGDHQRSHSSAAAAADSSDSQLDDVDAAAAMLALKHGPHVRMNIEQRKDEYHKQLTAVNLTSKGKKKSKDEDQDVLITSCPSEDHTYSVEHTQALHTEMYTYRFNNSTASSRAAIVKTEPTSPDEAFQEGSDSNSSWAVKAAKANGHRNSSSVAGGERDVEEQRKIAEGADALLNLAGIATSLRRSRSSTAAKRQRLQEDQVEATDEDEDEDRLVIKEEEEEEEERVPFRPRLLRKSPLKRDLMRREERKREKKACMKVLSYAQAIMESMEKNNNNSSSPPSTSPPSKVGGAKVRRKSLLAPVKHVAKVKR